MTTSPHPRQVVAGILLMIAAGFLFTVMDATAKYLSQRLPLLEVAWGRYTFHAATLPFLVARSGGFATLRSSRLGLQLWRSVFLLASTVIYWLALRYIPLADASAISFVGPLMLTALSVPLLKEKVGPRRWGAVAVGIHIKGPLVPMFAGLCALVLSIRRHRSQTTPLRWVTLARLRPWTHLRTRREAVR